MSKTRTRKTTETAAQAYQNQLTEAHRRLHVITEKLANQTVTTPHWGNVGDLQRLNELLRQVGHVAGVAEFVER